MLKLIELVLSNPLLYDPSDLYYNNVVKKEKIWFMIAEELGEDPMFVKKRWKNLRDSYLKHLKGHRYKCWAWAKHMKPFKPYLRTSTFIARNDIDEEECDVHLPEHIFEDVKTGFNTSDICTQDLKSDNEMDDFLLNEESEENKPEFLQTPTIQSGTSLHFRSRCKEKRFFHFKIPSELSSNTQLSKTLINSPTSKTWENKRWTHFDASDHMFLAFAKTIKTFSPQRQLMVKHEIANIIMRNETGNLLEGESEDLVFLNK